MQPPPAAPAASRHGQPGAPADTTFSCGGSWNRGNPGRSGRNPCGAFPDRPRGRDGPHAGGALRTGDPLLPGASCFGGGPGLRPGAGDVSRGRPGRTVASHALALLRPVQPLLDGVPSLRLPGQASCRGPPPGGGDTS